MNAIQQSILTSVGMSIAASVAAWAASHGLIPTADQSTIANDLVFAAGGAATLVIGWYKATVHTQQAQIDAVNDAPNGVKVVAGTAQAVQVDAPISQTGGLGMNK